MSSANAGCAVYVGNLDERVSDRVLYDILIQAGRVVDLYIPRDKEANRAKGYAFAEFETKEIAEYAVRLFSGLVTLHKRTLKFAISGQDKPPATMPTLNSSVKAGLPPMQLDNTEVSPHLAGSAPTRFSEHQINNERVLPGVVHQSTGYRSHFDGNNYDYSRRVFEGTIDSINRSRSGRFDTSVPINYPFH